MKQTHYLVKTAGSCPTIKHFVTLKGAQKFIERELDQFQDWYKWHKNVEEKEDALRLMNMMKPVPFEVDVPEYI